MVISPKFLKPLDPLKRELQKTTLEKSTSPQILLTFSIGLESPGHVCVQRHSAYDTPRYGGRFHGFLSRGPPLDSPSHDTPRHPSSPEDDLHLVVAVSVSGNPWIFGKTGAVNSSSCHPQHGGILIEIQKPFYTQKKGTSSPPHMIFPPPFAFCKKNNSLYIMAPF